MSRKTEGQMPTTTRFDLGGEGLPRINLGGAGKRILQLAILVLVIDRKSTRLNSSHITISYAVFCLKKKKKRINIIGSQESRRNRRRLKENQTGKKFRVRIKSNISTNRNKMNRDVDRYIHLSEMKNY